MDVSLLDPVATAAMPTASLAASPDPMPPASAGRSSSKPVAAVAAVAAAPAVAASPPSYPASARPIQEPEEAPLVPRELAVEAGGFDCAPSLSFSMTSAHPMVSPEEKAFIQACFEAFSETVEHEGGFREYAERDDCSTREELAGKPEEDEPPFEPEELLRRSCQSMLRQSARNGSDSIHIQIGAMTCMGMKKVAKIEIVCEDFSLQQQFSICWDWDVRLEQRSTACEEE